MFLVHVNYLAVLLSGIAAMVVGFLWYGPLFGKVWMKLAGMTGEKMEAAKAERNKTYGIMFVASLVMAYVLAHFVWYAAPGSLTIAIAVKTALWGWLGFIATSGISQFVTSPVKKPIKLFLIETGYYLVTSAVMGVIFGILK